MSKGLDCVRILRIIGGTGSTRVKGGGAGRL
jgi:hypothetical protein